MLKRMLALAVSVCIMLVFYNLNNKPLFSKYSESFTVYVGDGGSLCKMVSVNYTGYFKQGKINGESCSFESSSFDLNDFFSKFGAELVLVESTQTQTSYYAFSPKIKYIQKIDNKWVNLHVSVSENRVAVGSPIIYGSF